MAFLDSSWQDCPDTGRSTGSFDIFYQGGVVQSSSFVPDPVAMSSAEAEFNAACVTAMALAHLRQLVLEIRGEDPSSVWELPLLIDSRSAIAMGNSFRDTRHTQHIERWFHYIQWQVQRGFLKLFWIPGNLQVTDKGTKNLVALAVTYLLFRTIAEVVVKL